MIVLAVIINGFIITTNLFNAIINRTNLCRRPIIKSYQLLRIIYHTILCLDSIILQVIQLKRNVYFIMLLTRRKFKLKLITWQRNPELKLGLSWVTKNRYKCDQKYHYSQTITEGMDCMPMVYWPNSFIRVNNLFPPFILKF